MERFTRRMPGGYGLVYGRQLGTIRNNKAVIDRLAAYENTGFDPEEINELAVKVAALETIEAMYDGLGNPDHIRDLVRAEKEGRLAVLPCSTNGKLYVCGEKQVVECDIYEVYLDDKRGVECLVSYECNMDCNGCPFNNWKQDFEGEYSCDGEYCQAAVFASDFGKTVFLTREEAESAVKGRAADHTSTRNQV